MKIITNKISIVATLSVVLMTSCLGDLDTVPIDDKVITSDVVYTTKESYKAGLAKLYAAFALTGQIGPFGDQDVDGVDEGLSNFIRSVWYMNELTTDEAVWTYSGDAQNTIFNMHYNTWTPADPI